MGLEYFSRTLMLGVVLSASSVSATEVTVPAGHLGSSKMTSRTSAGKSVPNSQKQRRAENIKLKTNDHKVAADTEVTLNKRSPAADKSMDDAGEVLPENIPPAEHQSIALRGVRY